MYGGPLGQSAADVVPKHCGRESAADPPVNRRNPLQTREIHCGLGVSTADKSNQLRTRVSATDKRNPLRTRVSAADKRNPLRTREIRCILAADPLRTIVIRFTGF